MTKIELLETLIKELAVLEEDYLRMSASHVGEIEEDYFKCNAEGVNVASIFVFEHLKEEMRNAK